MSRAATPAVAVPWRGMTAHPGWLPGGLVLVAVTLSAFNLVRLLPPDQWLAMLGPHDGLSVAPALVVDGFLPRLVVCLLGGAALGLAGTLLQQVLRNPLAEPTTLGVSAGAQLALTAAALFGPPWLASGREGVALAGGAAATLLVFGLAWRRALAPLALVLAGLIVTLYAGSLAALLTLLHHDYLQSVFIWGAGSLVQNGWAEVGYLIPRLALGWVLAALLVRPLALLELDETSARSLGVPVRTIRFLALGAAVVAAVAVVSAVGVIGFVGLAAPALARYAGARRFGARLLWGPVTGAVLLWFTDALVQAATGPDSGLVPTGAVTAVVGAPLLLWLMQRVRMGQAAEMPIEVRPDVRPTGPWPKLVVVACFVVAVGGVAVVWGDGPQGWSLSLGQELTTLLPWRAPRLLAALAAGAMLAQAGTVLQRLTGNSLASPEVLGLSSGATIGAVALLYLMPEPARGLLLAAATVGAMASLVVILVVAYRHALVPERLLMGGIAIGTAMSALTAVLMSTGDPRLANLLTWLAGSTYAVTAAESALGGVMAVALFAATLLTTRWLDVLPLGEPTARALGVRIGCTRLILLLLAAAQTAGATLIVGPLSFVGLMAPHAARMLGLRRALPALAGAALLGMLVMAMSDWLGRNLMFPYQIPAGLMASLIGGPYLMLLMSRR